jgi:hypothetical protein
MTCDLTPDPNPNRNCRSLEKFKHAINGGGEAARFEKCGGGETSGTCFCLFVWECMMRSEELWTFYDPNLSSTDPNREITGKYYFERGSDRR